MRARNRCQDVEKSCVMSRRAVGHARKAVIRELARFPLAGMRGREIARHLWQELGPFYGLPDAELPAADSDDARRLADIVARQSDPRDRDLLLRLEPELYRQGWYSRRADVVRRVVGEFYRLGSGEQGAKQLHADLTQYAEGLYWSRGFPPGGNARCAALHALLMAYRGEVPSVSTLCRAAAGMEEPG